MNRDDVRVFKTRYYGVFVQVECWRNSIYWYIMTSNGIDQYYSSRPVLSQIKEFVSLYL